MHRIVNTIYDAGGEAKWPAASFLYVTSANIGIKPQYFLNFLSPH